MFTNYLLTIENNVQQKATDVVKFPNKEEKFPGKEEKFPNKEEKFLGNIEKFLWKVVGKENKEEKFPADVF